MNRRIYFCSKCKYIWIADRDLLDKPKVCAKCKTKHVVELSLEKIYKFIDNLIK